MDVFRFIYEGVYGAEIWSVTATLSNKTNSLSNACFRRILSIHLA